MCAALTRPAGSSLEGVVAVSSADHFQTDLGVRGQVFGDSVSTRDMLDRLSNHSQVLAIRNSSYRLREKTQRGNPPHPAVVGRIERVGMMFRRKAVLVAAVGLRHPVANERTQAGECLRPCSRPLENV